MAEQANRTVSGAPSIWRRTITAACRFASVLLGSTALTSVVHAQANDLRLSPVTRDQVPFVMDLSGPMGLVSIGLTILAAVVCVLHIVERQNWARRTQLQRQRLDSLQVRLQEAETFMAGEQQIVVSWSTSNGAPDVTGDLALAGQATNARDVFAFQKWLSAGDSDRLSQLVEKLKSRGEAFSLSVDDLSGKRLELDGRAVAGRAVMRIRMVEGDRLERIKAEESYGRLAGEMAALHAVLDSLPQPLWLRYPDGRLAWVNRAYAEAVDSRHPNDVVAKGIELIDAQHRAGLADRGDGSYGRIPAITAGKRHVLDVFDQKTPFGSGGIAVNAQEVDDLTGRLEALSTMQAQTLNAIPIAFAAFDSRQMLRFHNAAYEKLWGLQATFLAGKPTDGEILDKLRGHRRIPEHPDFKAWKLGWLAAYHSSESNAVTWHLPDGRVLNVRTEPTSDGGMSYLYEELTAAHRLEAEFKAVTKVQNETLDSLKEGVAVFGSDGRLKLANSSFTDIWKADASGFSGSPHIDQLIDSLRLSKADPLWSMIRETVVSMTDRRDAVVTKQTRPDGTVLECGMQPLSDGALLVTFADVTSDQRSADLMAERNDALETAARVKNEFIKNVTGEIKTPLQSVTLSVGMLADETIGTLNAKQKEYALDATQAADTILSLMTNIFDLASLDAGVLELQVRPTEPSAEVSSVLTALSNRIQIQKVKIETEIAPTIGSFEADPSRVRQILYHVIGNAVAFSPQGGVVTINAQQKEGWLTFTITDRGRGIPIDAQARIFERFEKHSDGSDHRGVGLGLSMVKALMELHGGEVSLESAEGHGTTVFCKFPIKQSVSGDPNRSSEKAA